MLDRLALMEDKVKNGVTVTVTPTQTEEQPKTEETKKKEVSKRLYAPLDVSSLTSTTPVVAAARSWEKISASIMRQCPYVAAAMTNRKITIDGEGIIILYSKKEQMLRRIAATYIKQAEAIFQKFTGTDLHIKAAFEDEIGDNIIDFWSVPDG